MSAVDMANEWIKGYDDAKGNYTPEGGRLMRDFKLILKDLLVELKNDELKRVKESQRLARGLKAVNSYRAVQRIVNIDEAAQVSVMLNDHCTVPHHERDEWEQF